MSDDLFSIVQPVAPVGDNVPEFSVSELAGGIKRTLENTFDRVRVRGEVCKPLYHGSGHLYFSLKDSDAVIDATCWKARVGRLSVRLEDGMDVIVTGQVTSYAKSSKYQINVETVALAGQGAMLKMLQDRKERLAKEGLFDSANKKPLPRFPRCIGIITSPTGAVIQDILHRLEDRFPVRVILWPVAVQGENAATQITDAIVGMNAMARAPDVIIVARGGGSFEDLMPFNEENVVRAAAISRIPLISAVGHETDTTLIDFASDVRAPTPTAAAELATPVRRELLQGLQLQQQRLQTALQRQLDQGALRVSVQARGLGDPRRYLESKMQSLDEFTTRLSGNTTQYLQKRLHKLSSLHLLHPRAMVKQSGLQLQNAAHRLLIIRRIVENGSQKLERSGALLQSYSYQRILSKGFALVRRADGSVVTAAAQLKSKNDIQLAFNDGHKDAVIK